MKLPNVWVGDEGLEISVGAKGRETLKLLPSPFPSHSDHDLVVHVPAAKVISLRQKEMTERNVSML